MKLGLYAPYSWREVTWLSLRLSTDLQLMGHDVEHFVAGLPRRGFWPEREKCLRVGVRNFRAQRPGLPATLWLHTDRHTRNLRRRDDIYVVRMQGVSFDQVARLSEFQRVVCPSERVFNLLAERVPTGQLVLCPWSCGERLTEVDRPLGRDGDVRLWCHWNAETCAEAHRDELAQALVAALERHPHLHIHCTFDRTVPISIWKMLQEAAAGGRMTLILRPDWIQLRSLLSLSDWLVLPDRRSDFGYLALEALRHGVAVAAHAIPPWNEFIVDGVSGKLVRCAVRCNWLGAPTAAPLRAAWDGALDEIAADPTAIDRMRRQDWRLSARAARYDSVWRNLIGKVDQAA